MPSTGGGGRQFGLEGSISSESEKVKDDDNMKFTRSVHRTFEAGSHREEIRSRSTGGGGIGWSNGSLGKGTGFVESRCKC